MSNIDKEYINPAEYKLSFGNGWNLFVNPDNTLTLANPNGQSVFTNIIAGITPQTIEFMDNNDSEIVHTNLDLEGNKIEIERISDGISSKWSVEVEQEKSIMHARLEVRSKSILTNPQLHVFTVPEGFIGISPDKIQVDYPGWQSWSPAERYGCLSDVLTLPQGMVEPYTPHTGADTLPFSWVTHFFTEEYNGITMGFTTVSDQEGIIETGKRVDNTKIDAWTYMACPNPRYDEITDEWVYTSDEFTLILDQDRNQGLAEYSERIKRQMALTDVVPDLNIGHNRWYIEKQGVTFDSVREIADIIINNPDKYPFTRVEFDDGWQVGKKIGDWQIDGSYKKLPEFIRGLHDKDKNVLIWVAPFILVNSSNAFKKINQDHPEWIVRDTSGKPLIAFENEEWEGDVHVLDLTNEDVQEYIADTIQKLVTELGLAEKDVLKLDFLSAGAAYAGTGAYRRAMTKIMERISDDIDYLLCGAPFIPSIGLGKRKPLMRISPDTNVEYFPKPIWNKSAPSVETNCWAGRRRANWLENFYIPDADNVVVTKNERFALSQTEHEHAIATAVLTGMQIMSVDVRKIDPEVERLIGRMLPYYGEAAKPIIDFSGDYLVLHTKKSDIFALFNRSEERRNETVPLNECVENPDLQFHTYDLFNEQYLGLSSGTINMDSIPPHGVRMVSLREVHRDSNGNFIPQLVSTDHLLGGAVEVIDEVWDGDSKTLSFKLQYPEKYLGVNQRKLIIYVPDGYRSSIENIPGNIMEVPVMVSSDETTLQLQFS